MTIFWIVYGIVALMVALSALLLMRFVSELECRVHILESVVIAVVSAAIWPVFAACLLVLMITGSFDETENGGL